MQHYEIAYNIGNRAYYETFAVCSKAVLCAEIDAIKAKGGTNLRVTYIN